MSFRAGLCPVSAQAAFPSERGWESSERSALAGKAPPGGAAALGVISPEV